MRPDDDVLVWQLPPPDDRHQVRPDLARLLERLPERIVAGGGGVQPAAEAPQLADQQALRPVGLGGVVVPPGERRARQALHDGADALARRPGDAVDVGRAGVRGRRAGQQEGGQQGGEAAGHAGW